MQGQKYILLNVLMRVARCLPPFTETSFLFGCFVHVGLGGDVFRLWSCVGEVP